MKKIILIIGLLFSLNIYLFSQNLVLEGKQWNVATTTYGPDGSASTSTQNYKFEGDVVDNNIVYKQVWISNNNASSWQTDGLIREENNVVYYKEAQSVERLIYNFNLDIGDTTIINHYGVDIEIEVIDIDYIDYLGTVRKTWQLGLANKGYWMEEFWVEGIGSLYGLLNSFYWYYSADISWELLCAFENEVEIYHSEYAPADCYYTNIGIEEQSFSNELSIYPNPVKKGDKFTIETNENIEFVSLYSIHGQLIKEFNPKTNKFEINTSPLNKGIYFIKTKSEKGSFQTFKLIIN